MNSQPARVVSLAWWPVQHDHRPLPLFEPGSGHVEFVVDKRRWGKFSPSTSVFPAKHSTDWSTLISIHHHPGLVGSVIVDTFPLHPIEGKKKQTTPSSKTDIVVIPFLLVSL
jgi:hypothetical protein